MYCFIIGISLKFTAKKGVLEMATLIPEKFNESSHGLLGNYNKNQTDDFQLPNGTSLFTDINVNATEREIYYDFGQQCKTVIFY